MVAFLRRAEDLVLGRSKIQCAGERSASWRVTQTLRSNLVSRCIRNNVSIEAKIDTKARIGVRTSAVISVWRPRSWA